MVKPAVTAPKSNHSFVNLINPGFRFLTMDKNVFSNLIDQLVPGWNTKPLPGLGGKTIDERFQVGPFPLWWFYSRLLSSHVLPQQLQPLPETKTEKIAALRGSIFSWMFKKYLFYNETIKQVCGRSLQHSFSKAKKTETGNDTQKKVLMLTYTNHRDPKTGTVYRLQPVFEALQQQREQPKLVPWMLFVDPLSQHSYSKIRIIGDTIYRFVSREDMRDARALARELHQRWKNIDKNYLFGHEWPRIKHTLHFFFSYELLYHTILYYFTSKQILKTKNIATVLLTSRNSLYEKCMMAAAYHARIPVVILQHGLGLGVFNPETFPGIKHAVFGEIYRQRLLKWGVDPKDVLVIGPTIFDDIYPYLQNWKVQKRMQKGKVVIITVPFLEEHRLTEPQYRAYLHQIFPEVKKRFSTVVIKLHPRENHSRLYLEEAQGAGISDVTITDVQGSFHLYSLMQDAELVINFFSTVALEAMILDKPVLTIDVGIGTVPYLEETPFTGTVIVRMDEDLGAAIHKAFSKEYRELRAQTVAQFCYKVDGKSSQRLAKEISRLVNK